MIGMNETVSERWRRCARCSGLSSQTSAMTGAINIGESNSSESNVTSPRATDLSGSSTHHGPWVHGAGLSASVVARSPLSYYVQLMYQICLSPKSEKGDGQRRRISQIRYICYCIVILFTILYVLRKSKYEIMTFLASKGHQIGLMMGAASYVVYGFTTIYFIYFLSSNWEQVCASLHCLEMPDSMYMTRPIQQVNKENKLLGAVLVFSTVLLVVMQIISSFFVFDRWSIERYVGLHSFLSRATFTVWSPKVWENETDKLWDESWENTSPLSIALTIPETLANIFGWMHEHMILDVILLLSISINQNMEKLVNIIQDDNCDLDIKWKNYQKQKRTCDVINSTFENILPVMHCNNLLLVSYLLLGGLLRKRYTYIFTLGMKVVKVLLTYKINSTTAHKNKHIQNWMYSICSKHDDVVIEGTKMEKLVLLDVVRNDPIGLGQDNFFLNQGFLLTFLGSVSTAFLVLANSSEDQCKACKCS